MGKTPLLFVGIRFCFSLTTERENLLCAGSLPRHLQLPGLDHGQSQEPRTQPRAPPALWHRCQGAGVGHGWSQAPQCGTRPSQVVALPFQLQSAGRSRGRSLLPTWGSRQLLQPRTELPRAWPLPPPFGVQLAEPLKGLSQVLPGFCSPLNSPLGFRAQLRSTLLGNGNPQGPWSLLVPTAA